MRLPDISGRWKTGEAWNCIDQIFPYTLSNANVIDDWTEPSLLAVGVDKANERGGPRIHGDKAKLSVLGSNQLHKTV